MGRSRVTSTHLQINKGEIDWNMLKSIPTWFWVNIYVDLCTSYLSFSSLFYIVPRLRVLVCDLVAFPRILLASK